MGDDEDAWRVMLTTHLSEHILPLLQPTILTLPGLCASVECRLHSLHAVTCPQHQQLPIECGILSIAALDTLSSFQAEVLTCGCGLSEECSGSCDAGGGLNKLPVVLMGVVRPDRGGVALVDSTGQVDCEMSVAVCTPDLIGHLVVFVQWNWIQTHPGVGKASSRRGYIEVENLESLLPSEDTPSRDVRLLSIARLKESMRKKDLPAREPVCVVGRVRALSECFRYGKSLFWLAELEDPYHSHVTHSILNHTEDLLHLSNLLRVSEVYEFTDLRDKVLNKGQSNEQRVLVTSQCTQVHPHVLLEEGQPPHKKRRSLKNSSLISSQMSPSDQSSLDTGDGLEQGEQELLSYTGVVTECVLPDAGVFQVDGAVRVYLTHQTCISQCRGLRAGARVELYNVHLLKVTAKHSKHLSGFYCCPRSTVRVSHFSAQDTPHKAFASENTLCALLRSYSPHDSAWLVELYISLRNRRLGAQISYNLLKVVVQALSLPPLPTRDIFTEFLGHTRPLHTLTRPHTPRFPLVSQLLEEVTTRTSSDGFHWSSSDGVTERGSGGVTAGGGGGLSHTPGTKWWHGRIKHSELSDLQFLVGTLHGNNSTGHVELGDCSGRLPVIPSHTPHTPPTPPTAQGPVESVLCGVGETVLITEFDIVAEKTQKVGKDEAMSTEFCVYVRKMCVCSAKPPSPVTSLSAETAASVCTAPKLEVEIVNKNEVHRDSSDGVHSFIALADVSVRSSTKVRVALTFSPQVFHLYSLINNGCVYELSEDRVGVTTSSAVGGMTLPSLEGLVQNHVIEVTQGMRLRYVRSVCVTSVQDVVELVSQTFLPIIPSLANRHLKQAKSENILVSLRGTIVSRGHRLDLTCLPRSSSTPPPMVVFTVQSSTHPDTIMIYCKNVQTLILGLVPGCVVTFHSVNLSTSKSGNTYCTCTSSSSVTVHSLRELERVPPYAVTAPMARLPTTLLHQLAEGLVNGRLTRRVVCVRGRFVSVQRVSLQYKCRGCQCVVVNGQCMVACLQRRPLLSADGRLVVDDGSGEAHVYVEGDLLRELLMVPSSDWAHLCELVRSLGTLTYTKPIRQIGPVTPASRYDSSPLTQAQCKLSDMATNPAIQRTVKLYCQPFVSHAELEECVLGQKSRVIFLREQRYNTLALPRLQLRAIAHMPLEGVSCVGECRGLLEEITPHSAEGV